MKSKRFQIVLTAFAVFAASLHMQFPVQIGRTLAGSSISAVEFLKKVSENTANPCRTETYSVIRYAPAEQCIYRDGIAVGDSFQGFCIRGGELLADAAQIGISGEPHRLVSLREAEEKTGAEVHTSDDGIYVSTPFRSARLIVKSTQTPPLYGAESVTEGYRDLHVLQFRDAEQAFQAYQKLKADPSVQYAEPSCTYAAATTPGSHANDIMPSIFRRWASLRTASLSIILTLAYSSEYLWAMLSGMLSAVIT